MHVWYVKQYNWQGFKASFSLASTLQAILRWSRIVFLLHILLLDQRFSFHEQGFVHLALQTRRPIVPIVLTGTHRAWREGSLHIRPTPISVKYLPPITTDDWTADKVEDYVKLVHDVYVKNLPESQRPPAWEFFQNNIDYSLE